jgi:hypothetical protein
MMTTEDLILQLQGGIRRWVLITGIICLVLAYPINLLGGYLSRVWFYQVDSNKAKYDDRTIAIAKNLREKQVLLESPNYVDLINGQKLIYSFLDNRQNTFIGYNPFVYKLQVLDKSGQILSDEVKTTYLLPGEARYISAYSDNPDAYTLSFQRMPETKFVEYNPDASALLKEPDIEVREKIVESFDKTSLTLKTSLKNATKFFIEEVEVVLLVRDINDSVIGVKNYKISGFLPGEDREIRLNYPKSKTRTAKSLDVRYSVNFLNQNSIRLK